MLYIRIYLFVIAFVGGACAGSFVNCAADRYAEKQSVFRGRSHCPVCGHTLGIIDLFPILSYLFLRGRCRHCGAPIPISCLLTEILGGLLFLSVALCYDISFLTLEYVLLVAVLFAVSLTDIKTMEIPDGALLVAVAVFAAFLPAHAELEKYTRDALIGSLALGGGMLVLSLLLDLLLKRETLGGGDIKLLFILGLFTGPIKGVLLILVACVFGMLFSLLGGRKKEAEFPFGPAIAAAALVTLLAGDAIIAGYLSLIL